MFLFMFAVTGAAALVIHLLFLLAPLKQASNRITEMSPILQTLCGTLFVLAIAFLANAVWATEDRAHGIVNDEALSIHTVMTYVQSMNGPPRDDLHRLTQDYARAVETEWPQMSEEAGARPSSQQIDDLYAAIIARLSEGEQNRMLQQRLLDAVDDLALARQHRLTIAKENVSGGQWFMVSQLGLLLLVVIAVCHGRWPVSRAVALFLITLAVSISLFVIVAHDRPFVGQNAVGPQPIMAAAGLGS